jgi:hypothetical protein
MDASDTSKAAPPATPQAATLIFVYTLSPNLKRAGGCGAAIPSRGS